MSRSSCPLVLVDQSHLCLLSPSDVSEGQQIVAATPLSAIASFLKESDAIAHCPMEELFSRGGCVSMRSLLGHPTPMSSKKRRRDALNPRDSPGSDCIISSLAIRENEFALSSIFKTNCASIQVPGGSLQIYKKEEASSSYRVIFQSRSGDPVTPSSMKIRCLEVSNTIGYVVADFCGVGGYQQVLFLPSIPTTLSQRSMDESYHLLLLSRVISQSILMDGIDMFLPRSLGIELATRTSSPLGDDDNDECSAHVALVLRDVTTSESIVFQEDDDKCSEAKLMNESSSEQKSALQPHPPKWVDDIFARALESRWMEERRRIEMQRETRFRRQRILKESQATLRSLLRPNAEDPRLVGVEVRVLPTAKPSSFSSSESLSATIIMTVTIENSSEAIPMRHVHISACCSMSETDVKTHSGVVPILHAGLEASVRVIGEIDGINVQAVHKTPLRLGLEVHWQHGSAVSSPRRMASRVGGLELPLDMLLLSKPSCALAMPGEGENRRPSTIYECREPHVVRLDVSRCTCSWVDWTSRLNELLRDRGHYVEFRHPEGGATATLAIYAFPATLSQGLTHLVMQQLPDTAKIHL